MTDGLALQIGQQALWVMVLLAGPVLGLGLVVGLVIGVLQASTQVNEQTLSLLPKLAAMGVAVLIFGPWMLTTLVDFTRHLLVAMPGWL